MFERSELWLKLICGVAGALVVYQLVLVIAHINPLYHVAIPKLPTLSDSSPSTNAVATNPGSTKQSQPADAHATGNTATNTVSRSSNAVARVSSHEQSVTNAGVASTNLLGAVTNASARTTNVLARLSPTNIVNQVEATNKTVTMASGAPPPRGRGPGGPPFGMPGMRGMPGMPGMPSPGPALPPEIQARLDRVVDSEILAPVMRPMPMALLGIAGPDVFLRTPNGQTGLVKEGDELGGIKVLRVGVNRVLVEEQGERKELTIFSGFGSESLLSTQKTGLNETITTTTHH